MESWYSLHQPHPENAGYISKKLRSNMKSGDGKRTVGRSQGFGNWYFGWNIVAAATVLTLFTVGMRLGVGPFFIPITEDLGFSRSVLASIIAVGMLVYGFGMPMAGYLINARSTRFVLLLGMAIVLLSIAGSVLSTGPVSFLLFFGIGLSLGLALLSPVALTPVISRWFTLKRGMALFFLSTGSMAGIALLTPVLGYMIEAYGWKATLVTFGVIMTAITVPSALFIINDNAPPETDTGNPANRRPASRPAAQTVATGSCGAAEPAPVQRPTASPMTVSKALHTAPYWQIFFGLFACGYSMNLLGTHGVPMLMDHGFDAMTSSFGIGLIGLAAIFSTLVLGRLSDIYPRKNILGLIYFMRGLGFFALVSVGANWELFTASTIGGFVWAGSVALSSAILADIYGVRLVGILYGWAYLGHQVGGMISSWLGGWAYETFHTHWVSFGSAGIILLLAALVSFRLPRKGYTLVPPNT